MTSASSNMPKPRKNGWNRVSRECFGVSGDERIRVTMNPQLIFHKEI
jgi:hypothetical protein